MKAPDTEVYRQLYQSGYIAFIREPEYLGNTVRGTFDLLAIVNLIRDPRFMQGGLHHLHADVGENRTEFRSFRGSFGKGSLQIVIDLKTGKCYADVDIFNPYADAVNWIGHAFGEVVPNRIKRWLT